MKNPLVELLTSGKGKDQSFTEKPIGHLHEYYLSDTIEGANEYTEWFDEIRNCNPTDIVKIYINSTGGDLWAAVQFMRVIRECKAPVIASVEGACMSAATIVFLMADSYEISPHSMFMFHNYSGGTMGKGGEMIDQIKHERKWSEKLFTDIYKNFLKDEEIKSILNNRDIWMTGEEVVARLNHRKKINEKQKKEVTKKKKDE